ncbi:hypothetical protein CANMA_001347 [Candida margitis]|uniref:uncharacterized protein n=1 Tax=Candida margitis TaxID=1775924 RepID=UPI002227E7B1|nr:uncharacterized protein CANMA_001347 [Candida margitis]KAI5969684.1 hypothetical protein CANMA_001347 [Candida margitis]
MREDLSNNEKSEATIAVNQTLSQVEAPQDLANNETNESPSTSDNGATTESTNRPTQDLPIDEREESNPLNIQTQVSEKLEQSSSSSAVDQMQNTTVGASNELGNETADDIVPLENVKAPEEEVQKEESLDQIASFINQDQKSDAKIDALSDDEIDVEDVSSDDSRSSSDSRNSSEDSESDSDESEQEEENDANGNEDGLDEDEEVIDGPIKSVNEVTNENVPTLPEGYEIPKSAPIEEIGEITGLVDRSIIIKAKTSGEFRILKEGSVLCLEDKTLIGLLYEIFGRVQSPIYTIRFNSDEDFEKFKDAKGKSVYYVVPDSQFLYTDTIKHNKGTDASNCHDEELPEDEQEFSDDEQELAAKQAKKKRKNKNKVVKERKNPNLSLHRAHIPAYSPITSARSSTESARRTQHHGQESVGSSQSHHSSFQPTSHYQQPQHSFPQQSSYGTPPPYNNSTVMYGSPQPQYQQQSTQSFSSYPYPQQYFPQFQSNIPQYGQAPYNPVPHHQPQHQHQFQTFAPPPQQNPTSNSQQNVDPAQLARLQELLIQQMQNAQHHSHQQ